MTFHDIYREMYALDEPLHDGDSIEEQARKTFAYFQAKLFFHAGL